MLTYPSPQNLEGINRHLHVHPMFEITQGDLDGEGPVPKLDYRPVGVLQWERVDDATLN